MRTLKHALTLITLCLALAGCAYGNFMDQGDALSSKGQYDNALVAYQNALGEKPDSDEAKRKIHEMKVQIMQRHRKVARDRLDAQDYLGAIHAAQSALDYAPEPRMAQGIVEMVGASAMDRATQHAIAGEFEESLRLLGALSSGLDYRPEKVQPEIERVRQTWSQTLSERAAISEKEGHTGDALLLYAQASSLTMKPSDAAKRDELYGIMLEKFAYNVHVKSRGALASMRFVERVTSPEFEQNLVFVPDAKSSHLSLQVDVGRPMFSQRRSMRMMSQQYQSGVRLVSNPEYERRRSELEQQRRRVQEAQQRVQRANNDVQRAQDRVHSEGPSPDRTTSAESSLNSARNQLDSAQNRLNDEQAEANRDEQALYNTPQQKEEPVFSDLTYPVETYTMTAQMPYRALGKHADGRPALERAVSLQMSKSDDTHGAYHQINLAMDPLELPSRDDAMSFLYKSAITQTHRLAFESLSGLRKILLEDALSTQQPAQKVHKLVIYIMLDPVHVSPDALSAIAAVRGISDAPALLTKPRARKQ